MEVDLEDVGTVFGEGVNSVVLELATFIQLQSLNIATTCCQVDHALVGDILAARNVESLKATAVFGDGIDRLLGNVLVVGNVECQQRGAILHKGDKSGIGEVATVRKCQTFHPTTDCERHNTTITDFVSKGGEVEPLDKVAISERRCLELQRLANAAVVLPTRARRSMPELIDCVSSPAFANQHAVEQIGGGTQFGKHADEYLVWQPMDGRLASIFHLHILKVGNSDA